MRFAPSVIAKAGEHLSPICRPSVKGDRGSHIEEGEEIGVTAGAAGQRGRAVASVPDRERLRLGVQPSLGSISTLPLLAHLAYNIGYNLMLRD